MSAHPDIFACPRELGAFNKIGKDDNGQPTPLRIDRLYTSLLINRIPDEAKRLCEKSPSNIHHIDDIEHYYNGNFRFIQIIRDGRDVVLSTHPTAKNRFWVNPQRWVNDVSKGLEYRNHPKVHTVYYEDLVKRFDETIRKICTFLNMDVCDEILQWQRYAKVTRNRAYFEGLKALSDQSIGKWRNTRYKERVNELLTYPGADELLTQLQYC